MGNKFDELTKNERCLLVGRVARMYDLDMSLRKIAEDLDEPIELIHEIIGIILVAREPKRYS